MKILILKPSSLGDVVQALPVLRLLKLHRPDSEIFWWLDSGLAPLLADDPDLAGIFPFERKGWMLPGHWPAIFRSTSGLRRERFDWAIDLQGLARSGLFTWLAGAQISIGLDNAREGAREGARMFYDLLAPSSPPGTHAVDRYLGVLPALGVPVHSRFQWLPDRPRVAAAIRKKWDVGSARWIALLPGARWDNKRWPLAHFQQLAALLLPFAPDVKLAVIGGPDDCELGKAITAAVPERCLDLTGKTSLPEMVEWLRICSLVITNDTGPMHVAAALQKPVVAMFGPTDPGNTGPYGQRQNVIQAGGKDCLPCGDRDCPKGNSPACMSDITPAMVLQRARDFIVGSVSSPDELNNPRKS